MLGYICVALPKVAKESTISERADSNIRKNSTNFCKYKLLLQSQGNIEVESSKVTFTRAQLFVRRSVTVTVAVQIVFALTTFGSVTY
jgi:hypothetical protein